MQNIGDPSQELFIGRTFNGARKINLPKLFVPVGPSILDCITDRLLHLHSCTINGFPDLWINTFGNRSKGFSAFTQYSCMGTVISRSIESKSDFQQNTVSSIFDTSAVILFLTDITHAGNNGAQTAGLLESMVHLLAF